MLSKRRRGELDRIQRNAAGEFIYTGLWYVYQGGLPRKRMLAELWIFCGGAVLAILAAGLLPAPGMSGCWYVPVPYVLCLAAAASALWSLGQLTAAGDPVREHVRETGCRRIPMRLLAAAALAAFTALGEGIYLLRSGGVSGLSLAFLGLMLLSGGLALIGRSRAARMKWAEKP